MSVRVASQKRGVPLPLSLYSLPCCIQYSYMSTVTSSLFDYYMHRLKSHWKATIHCACRMLSETHGEILLTWRRVTSSIHC